MDPRALGSAVPDDDATARFAKMTPEQRLAIFLELCRLTDSIVRHRPDADALRAPTPRSAASEALFARLIREARDERARR